jgi:hypothetical protein
MTAMQHGKHVYCEKPLTQNLYEARTVRETAAQSDVVTQMGNQGTASEAFRRTIEWVRSGALGEIREVHAWNTGGGAGDRPLPEGAEPVPDHLVWDLWLGPASKRQYHADWLNWHTWRDFATGQLGNWASHTLNAAFKSLRLDALWQDGFQSPRLRVQAEVSGIHHETFPRSESIRFEFPAREGLPPVTVHWHNGAGRAPNRELLEDLAERKLDWGDAGEKKWRDHAGCILVGNQGKVHLNGHNTTFALLPADKFQETDRPARSLPRSPGHEKEWLQACKGGPQPMSHFGYGGPLTEFVLLGNIATQFEGAVEFDPASFQITNRDDANDALRREYRFGWSLGA